MSDDNKLTLIKNMSELSEKRLWCSLDAIVNRLVGIETQLSAIVRLEERIHSHEEAIGRYGKRLDTHDSRIRCAELWQANHGDRSSNERLITDVQQDVSNIKREVAIITTSRARFTGQKDVGKEVLKWTVGILTTVILYIINKAT